MWCSLGCFLYAIAKANEDIRTVLFCLSLMVFINDGEEDQMICMMSIAQVVFRSIAVYDMI